LKLCEDFLQVLLACNALFCGFVVGEQLRSISSGKMLYLFVCHLISVQSSQLYHFRFFASLSGGYYPTFSGVNDECGDVRCVLCGSVREVGADDLRGVVRAAEEAQGLAAEALGARNYEECARTAAAALKTLSQQPLTHLSHSHTLAASSCGDMCVRFNRCQRSEQT
jgi:hypothetical protein